MSAISWNPSKAHDVEFIGQCMRDEERPRLERFAGQPARLAFAGVHNGALDSLVLRVGGQPIGMFSGHPCSTLGLRVAWLALTPSAEKVHDLDPVALQQVRQHAQGDALGMVASTELGDTTQARWLQALGFRKAPATWTEGMTAEMFYAVQPGAELVVRAFFLDGLEAGFDAPASQH
jgi:hypothetical protein